MKKFLFVKLQIVCLVFAAHGFFNVSLASSIQFAIDASLNQQELDVVRDVVATISQAADESDSIGIVVYDSVFQRGTPIAIADAAQKDGVLETLLQITPSDSSNLAVGIEKGTSELTAEGGYLIVFGQSEIQVADAEKLTTYTDWLKWVLLPDSEKAGIEILLVSPPAQNDSASFQTSVTAFFPISDANSLINDLSTALPGPLVNRLGDPVQLSSLPELAANDVQVPQEVATATPTTLPETNSEQPEVSNVATTESVVAVEEENLSTDTNILLIGISIALLGALVAAGLLIVKLFRKSRQRTTAVRAQGIHGADHVNSGTAYMPPELRQGASAVSDNPTVARQQQPKPHEKSNYNVDNTFEDGDETVQNPAVPPHNLDATLPRAQRVETDLDIEQQAETSDDLEEIRALTKQREESMI